MQGANPSNADAFDFIRACRTYSTYKREYKEFASYPRDMIEKIAVVNS